MTTDVLFIRGRHIFSHDIEMIRRAAALHWGEGLAAIATEVCRIWAWRNQASGFAVNQCEKVLISLSRMGIVDIPEEERRPRRVGRPLFQELPILDTSPITGVISDPVSVTLRLVESEEEERVYLALMGNYHPLGNRRVIGSHLKYIAWLDRRPVAALLWGRAALKLYARDSIMGWTPEQRRQGISRIANNYRFLIPPWVKVRNLASFTLCACARRISGDWKEAWGESLEVLETFVDIERYTATSYLAANWIPVGFTQGHGRRGPCYHFHGHRKLILLYPLSSHWRRKFCQVPLGADALKNLCVPGSDSLPFGQEALEGGAHKTMRVSMEVPSSIVPDRKLGQEDIESFAKDFIEYLDLFNDTFDRSDQWENSTEYIRGLLSNVDGRHNAERIALYGPVEKPPRTIQAFLTESTWKDDSVRIRHELLVSESLGDPNGLLIFDGTDFAKQGKESAGVARQYCGATGKIDNCQASVFAAYSSVKGTTLIDGDLYIPKSWYSEEKMRWKRCRIPEGLPFRTKSQIAIEILESIHHRGQLPIRWILADEGFGKDPGFLDRIPESYFYFCEVPCDTRVWTERPPLEEYKSRRDGSPRIRVNPKEAGPFEVNQLQNNPALVWEERVLKEGAKGPIRAQIARMRVIEVRNCLPGKEVWLFMRRSIDTGEMKYFLSSATPDVTMEEMAAVSAARWPIETAFKEAKSELGMDQYELRSWTGWHHHMTLVMLAHHFLVRERLSFKKKHLL